MLIIHRHWPLFLIVFLGLPYLSGCENVEITPSEYVANAEDFLDKGELRSAVIELKNALRKDPNTLKARWLLGRIYLEQGAGASAEKEFRWAVELGMAPEAAAIPLARALLLQGKHQQVIDSAIHPTRLPEAERTELLALKANAYLRLGKSDKAEEFYDTVLSIKADNPEALTGKALLLVAQNQRDEARKQLATVLKAIPDFASAWGLLGLIELQEGNLEQAEEAYNKAMQDPIRKDANQQSRALVRIGLKKYDQAAEDIKALRQRYRKNPHVDYLDGLLHFKQKHFDQALGFFDAVLGRLPNHMPAQLYGGATNAILGNYSSAQNLLHRYLSRDPQNIMVKRLLAHVELESGNPAEAEKLGLAVLGEASDDVMTMNILADALSNLGDPGAAVDYLKQVVVAQPDSASARTRLGTMLATEGKVKEGFRELEQALALDPQLHRAADMIIRQHLRAGDLNKALTAAREHRDVQPNAVPAHMLLGIVHLARKERDAASKAFQQALEIEPTNVPANSGLALIAIQEKKLEKAEAYYRDSLKHHPDDLQTLMNLAKLEIMQGDEASVQSVLEDTIKRHPTDLEPRLLLSRLYLLAGQADKAINTVRDVRSQHPESKNLLGLLAESELAAGRYAEAKMTLTRLAKLVPEDPRVHLFLSQAYEGLNDREKMAEALERAAVLDPDLVPAQLSLARLAMQDKKTDEAEIRIGALKTKAGAVDNPALVFTEAQLAEITDDLPGAVTAYQHLFDLKQSSVNFSRLSRAQWNAGDRDRAVKELEQWVREHPNDRRVLLELAQRYVTLQRTQEAIAIYKSVLEALPDNALALNNLASLLSETAPQAALGYAERVYVLFPGDPAVMDTLAGALLSTGDRKRAERLIKRALAQRPQNLSFRYHHAKILEADGRSDEAKRVLDETLRRRDNFPGRVKAEAMLKRLKAGS